MFVDEAGGTVPFGKLTGAVKKTWIKFSKIKKKMKAEKTKNENKDRKKQQWTFWCVSIQSFEISSDWSWKPSIWIFINTCPEEPLFHLKNKNKKSKERRKKKQKK